MPATLYISVHDSVRVREQFIAFIAESVEDAFVVPALLTLEELFPSVDFQWAAVEARAPSSLMADYKFIHATV